MLGPNVLEDMLEDVCFWAVKGTTASLASRTLHLIEILKHVSRWGADRLWDISRHRPEFIVVLDGSPRCAAQWPTLDFN
jgi:hypothetical protein